jgi:hypothetical protein
MLTIADDWVDPVGTGRLAESGLRDPERVSGFYLIRLSALGS